ncbi:MAG: hypothetical protein ACXW1R_06760 [Halobacteriota archaeon]
MNSNCVEVDELILQLADYKNDYADVAAEKLLRKCSRSGKRTSIWRTIGMTHGFQTAHGNN